MSEYLSIEKLVNVNVTVYDVVDNNGYDLDFTAESDGDGDIRIVVDLNEDSCAEYLENSGYVVTKVE